MLYTLTPPETFRQRQWLTFTPPDGTTMTLEANTSYFLSVEWTRGAMSLSMTKADSEDATSDPGWSLADVCRAWNSSKDDYTDCLFSKALRVLINGPSTTSQPLLSISDAFATEGSAVEFAVTMSKAAEAAVTVQYSTADGTATADANAIDGADYAAASNQTVTFAIGETTQTISVPTGGDSVDEGDETFTVTLSDPSGSAALGATVSATGTIVDDDETPLTDATLSALALSDGDGTAIGLTPSFDRYVGIYSAEVANDVDSLTAVATTNQSGATFVFVGADSVGSDGAATYELDVGSNLVKAMVTSQDGNRTKIYMVSVTRQASDDATLSGLTVSDSQGADVALVPASFDPDTLDYTARVANSVDSATVAVTKNHAGAAVLIIVGDGTDASESVTLDLNPGDNFVKVMVTAEDGVTVQIYNLYITREAPGIASDATLREFEATDSNGSGVLLWSSFDPDVGLYDASVRNSVTSITATVTPNRFAATLLFVDGDTTGTPGQVTRDLEVGENRLKIMVTAEDGVSTKIYVFTIRRAAADASSDAALSSLTLQDLQGSGIDLDPAPFSPTTTDYSASVAYDVDSATVTATPNDPDAVALIFKEDGSHSHSSMTLDLAEGANSIKVMVNAEDAATAKIYNLTVTKASAELSDDATLSALTVKDGGGATIDLAPTFDPATTDYSATVSDDVATVTVAATKNQAGATATIIATDGTETEDSGTSAVAVGDNLVLVTVAAEDGFTELIYTITLTRTAAWSATLTVGSDTSYVPSLTGFSTWSRTGALSDRAFQIGATRYGVMTLMRLGDGLFLTTHRELPWDFTLRIGDHEYAARDSLQHVSASPGNYWWSAEDLTWTPGETLEVTVTPVDGSQEPPSRAKAPPTAVFLSVPDNHDGTDPLEFRLYFTDNVDVDAATLRDDSLQVANGTVTSVERVTDGSNTNWTVTVQPDSADDVTVTLPASQDCATQGAICTDDDRQLHNTVEVTIPGPAGGL